MGHDVRHVIQDFVFMWDSDKADINLNKHGVSFQEACEVFFFPYYRMEDAGVYDEKRWAFIGFSRADRSLYVIAAEHGEEAWRIISARRLEPEERRRYEKEDDPY